MVNIISADQGIALSLNMCQYAKLLAETYSGSKRLWERKNLLLKFKLQPGLLVDAYDSST
jgi:hypothetical protein